MEWSSRFETKKNSLLVLIEEQLKTINSKYQNSHLAYLIKHW
jgi:hypothetical protein